MKCDETSNPEGFCRWLATITVMLLGLAGCAERALVASHVAHEGLPPSVRRVVVVPFQTPHDDRALRTWVTEAFAIELQKAGGLETIAAPQDDDKLGAEAGLWRRGCVRPETIIQAQKRYRADAFLFGTITHYKPYDPPMLGVKVQMISARSGLVLWAATGVFDAADKRVNACARAYFNDTARKGSIYGERLVLMSSRLFAQFVAHEVVAALEQSCQASGRGLTRAAPPSSLLPIRERHMGQ